MLYILPFNIVALSSFPFKRPVWKKKCEFGLRGKEKTQRGEHALKSRWMGSM